MNILIWGTSGLAERVLKSLKAGRVIGFIESIPKSDQWMGLPIFAPNNIVCSYDKIIVASTYGNEILDLIYKNEIPIEKVCFIHISYSSRIDCIENYCKIKDLIDERMAVCIAGYEEDQNNYVVQDRLRYNRLNKRKTLEAFAENDKFIFTEKYDNAGAISNYFWQDLWAARLIHEAAPAKHYDIGSRVDGFVAHLLSFRKEVFLVDIRPLTEKIEGLNFVQADATNLDGISDNSIESLSALCSLEHFGLGRYGDKIDPEACFKAFEAIQYKMRRGGIIYISVPIGREHVEFNAHRIFYAETIVEAFSQMELLQLDCCNGGKIEYDIDIHKYDNDNRKGCDRFGLFRLRKK